MNMNVEETKTSTSVIENEDKNSRLLEKKNEENRKSYAELLKGRNHGQPESKKTIEDTSSRRPSMFKQQISFSNGHDDTDPNPRAEIRSGSFQNSLKPKRLLCFSLECPTNP
jgi:hypothetical protein